MKPQEINERIARLCGWFPVEDTESGLWHLSNMDGRTIGYRSGLSEDHAWRVLCPDYFDSLDACANFERDLPLGYIYHLIDVLKMDRRAIVEGYDEVQVLQFMRATPAQRCEAFLRMKGQWE